MFEDIPSSIDKHGKVIDVEVFILPSVLYFGELCQFSDICFGFCVVF